MDTKTLKILEFDKIVNMLAEHASSSLGEKLCLDLKPSSEKSTVKRWLDETTEAEVVTIVEGTGFIGGFPDIGYELRKAKIGSVLSPHELIRIAQTLSSAKGVKERMRRHKSKTQLEIIPALVHSIILCPDLLDSINRCIESDERISDNASPLISDLRRQISRTHDKIRDRLNGVIRSPQSLKMLQEPIITIRNDRYVVPVKQEYRSSFPGIVHDQSSTGATLFIEPMSVVEANNELRSLAALEEQEIERILSELTAMVEDYHDYLTENLSILAKLDFIFAKGAFSLAQRAIRPRLVNDRYFNIKNGRHPLIDKDKVVPISISLGREYNALVITGPNTGGKTVTLKTAGLFLLMAQSGLHLPADHGTEIGVFNNVFADIGDEQSIEQSLSTFSSHMTNIVKIIKRACPYDLVLFDELGAGTDPTEGAALAMSILDYLHSRGIRTLATTHYSELKVYALNNEGVENASVEFNVETLSPTYRLITGLPGRSNAFEISKRLGLDDSLIEGARKYLTKEAVHFEDVIRDIEGKRIKVEHDLDKAKAYLQEINDTREKLAIEKEELQSRKSDYLSKAREEARRIVKEAKAQSEAIIKELQRVQKEAAQSELNKSVEDARKKLKTSLEDLQVDKSSSGTASKARGKPPKDLKLGEEVYVISLDQTGQVLTLPDQNGELTIQMGIMKVNVNISDIRRVRKESTPVSAPRSNKKVTLRKAVSSELDLRGMNAEDAIIETDKYLDEAFLSGLTEVTIIHGKGTGILRSTVHQCLKHHPHVEAFRLGKFGEGESGVTICTLK